MANVRITVTLPALNPHDFGDSVAHVQHILNDIDRWNGEETLLSEDGDYRDKTKERVRRFQEDNGISPATGGVGTRTWTALLETWSPPPESR
jgi:peptidoglycan hydrolase-like protein with peptidoglycan-binding domain